MSHRRASRRGNGEDRGVDLPVIPPIAPMLARLERELPPARPGDIYEPKWDGFRALVFRHTDGVEIWSRGERPFTRYFPELTGALAAALPQRCVLDGEIVVPGPGGLDFTLLQQRIHPAETRIERLARELPAAYIAFDLLALRDRDLRAEPFRERRRLLEAAFAGVRPPLYLTPATTDRALAEEWLERFVGAGIDGVVVKDSTLPYLEDKRAMVKVKRERTADCVVGGFRVHKDGRGAGSLLLGLHDARGRLHHVGVASGLSARQRAEVLGVILPYRMPSYLGHPWEAWQDEEAHQHLLMPGTPSRWQGAREAAWVPLRPELVCEVRYEQLQGARFRHPARFVRWRPDRSPESCTYTQLVTTPPPELLELLGT